MKTLERHIIRQFVINYAILFAVLLTLIVTIDLIVNVDEFVAAADRLQPEGSRMLMFAWLVWDFYWPMTFLFYLYLSPLLTVAAAGFTLGAMIRTRELTALLAGGVSLYRVAMPLIFVSFLCSGLLLVDQELVIPALKDKLSRGHSHLKHGGVRPFTVQFVPDQIWDNEGNLVRNTLLTAARFNAVTNTMDNVVILRRDTSGRAVARIAADQAVWDEANHGWRLINGWSQPRARETDISEQSDAGAVRTQAPTPVTFVPSSLDPTTLVMHRHSDVRGLLSRAELRELLDRPTLVESEDLLRMIHSRNALLAVNVLLVIVGVPFFLVRTPRNLLLQSVKASLVILGAYAGVFVMMRMPLAGVPPALTAWLPAITILPLALWQLDRVET